jgi:hypothetical protein
VRTARVDVGRVPEAELHDHGRGYPDEVRYLVVPHEPAEVVRYLDVNVQRNLGRGPDRRELGQRQVSGHVVRACPELFHRLDGRRVGRRQLHGDLQDQVLRQLTLGLEVPENPKKPRVGDQHPAQT